MRRLLLACGFLALAVALYAQRGRRSMIDDDEDSPLAMPADAGEKTEWAFARLKYPTYGGGRWRASWTIDYPKADRQFVQGVRRLTRLHTRSVEQVVDVDSDEMFNWPWIYAVEVGHWELNDRQAKRMRDYLLRGGFLMVDDFHGTAEWAVFTASMSRVFPDRPITELANTDQIFHVIYDLSVRYQVYGTVVMGTGRTYERDGIEPRWRAILDDKGRVMVAICHNMDLGDAWEWADSPQYPEHLASLAYRIGVNYIIYAMSH